MLFPPMCLLVLLGLMCAGLLAVLLGSTELCQFPLVSPVFSWLTYFLIISKTIFIFCSTHQLTIYTDHLFQASLSPPALASFL